MRHATMKAHGLGAAGLALIGGMLMHFGAHGARAETRTIAPDVRTGLVEDWGRRPLTFEQNRGQTDAQVRFLARGPGYMLFLTSSEAILSLAGGGSPDHVVRLAWAGAARAPEITGEEVLSGKVHYLKGKHGTAGPRHVPTFARVRYQRLYPGVDLEFYGNEGRLEYDLLVSPGSDPGRVCLTVEGADTLAIDPTGALLIRSGEKELKLLRPFAYQEVDGVRREVDSAFRLIPGALGVQEIGFRLGAFDHTRPLVIDPVLVYSTYLGGSGLDVGSDIATDGRGNAYVTGSTNSPDFPIVDPLQATVRQQDAFVTKLDSDGNVVYSTYLGSHATEGGHGIAVDAAGNAYVVGLFTSDFPLVNPLPPSFRLASHGAFVAKLDPSGSSLVYSTTLSGSQGGRAEDVAVDPLGHAYVIGLTSSTDFPLVRPVQDHPGGSIDVFVTKLTPDGSGVVFSTYLGGRELDWPGDIDADPAGHALVTGFTFSLDFPTFAALAVPGPNIFRSQAFVAKLAPEGATFVYSTFLGGANGGDSGAGIDATPAGEAWVAGSTTSSDFQTVDPIQPVLRGSGDAFAAKLSSSGALVFSTFFGGSAGDSGADIAEDPRGGIYLAGSTRSSDFPLEDPVDECLPSDGPTSCQEEGFVAKLDPERREIVYSTYLGGSDIDRVESVAAGPAGDAYVTGTTESDDFPVWNAFDPTHGGAALGSPADAFVVKLETDGNRSPDCAAASAVPSVIWPPNGRLVPIAIAGIVDPDSDLVTVTVTGITQDEPIAAGPTATGVGTSTVRVRAERAGGGDGRVYRVSFEGTDTDGASCTGTAIVCVPHDRRPGTDCRDSGLVVDATGARR